MRIKQNIAPHFLRSASRGLVLSACLALAACASVSTVSPQDQVRQRAKEHWQALVAGEFNRAYTYIIPSYRAVVSADRYRGHFGTAVSWLGNEVLDVNCPETDRCVARSRIDFRPTLSRRMNLKFDTYVDETWLFQDGQWWLFMDLKAN
jgi:hypothetical protein